MVSPTDRFTKENKMEAGVYGLYIICVFMYTFMTLYITQVYIYIYIYICTYIHISLSIYIYIYIYKYISCYVYRRVFCVSVYLSVAAVSHKDVGTEGAN